MFIETFTMCLNSQENIENSSNPAFSNINVYRKSRDLVISSIAMFITTNINNYSITFVLLRWHSLIANVNPS